MAAIEANRIRVQGPHPPPLPTPPPVPVAPIVQQAPGNSLFSGHRAFLILQYVKDKFEDMDISLGIRVLHERVLEKFTLCSRDWHTVLKEMLN